MKIEKLLFQHGAAAMIADTIIRAAKQIGFDVIDKAEESSTTA